MKFPYVAKYTAVHFSVSLSVCHRLIMSYVPANDMYLPLLLVCLLCPLCGATEYYVKPTEPTNASCPGLPCLTLAQYTADSDHYFKSNNNNTVFWFLSGTHNISLPVIITDAHNITLERYGEGNSYPRILFRPSYYCWCAIEDSIMGACKDCSAVQFDNVSMATVSGLEIIGWRYNKTSSINGLSFDRSNILVVQNISVVIEQFTSCHQNCVVSGLIFFHTSHTFVDNLTTSYARLLLHRTVHMIIQNIALYHSEIFTNATENTVISGANITNSTAHGITTRRSKNMVIQYVRVTNTSGHCMWLQYASNISLFNVSILECKDNGIETTMSECISCTYPCCCCCNTAEHWHQN